MMTKPKISKLILNSENFESFTIPVKAIDELQIDGITTNVTVDQDGQLQRSHACHYLVLQARLDYLHRLPTDGFNGEGKRLMLDERLATMPDLVDVDLVDTKGRVTTISLPWRDGDSWDINAAIKTETQDGLLLMTVE